MTTTIKTAAASAITGLGIGWLIGLSTSPVVAAVIATLLAAAAAIAGAGKLTDGVVSAPLQVSPLPLALLTIGISIAATCGMEYRTARLLRGQFAPADETNLGAVVERWVSIGAKKEDVVQRLLERELPVIVASASSEPRASIPTGLVSDSVSDVCAELRAASSSKVFGTLAASPDPELRSVGQAAIDLELPDSFAERLRSVLCPAH